MDTRRCNSEACNVAAVKRSATLDMPLATVLVNPTKDWQRLTMGNGRVAKRVIDVDWKKFNQDNFLFSHCSIVCSVAIEDNGYYIMPCCSELVNNNGNAWTNEVLLATFQSFRGAENYCFVEGTRILMADGTYKEIQDVKVGDRVINRKGVIDTVKNTGKRWSDSLVKISSTDIMCRDLFVTDEHPFWVFHARETCPKTGRPNGFSPVKDFYHLDSWTGFSVGVHKAKGEAFPCGLTSQWKNAGQLDVNRDFLTHPVSSVEIACDDINENRVELIGWFLAEGSYAHTNDFSEEDSGVVFNLGNDEQDVAERIQSLLWTEFSQFVIRPDCKVRIEETESGSLNVRFSNREVARFFYKWCGKWAWAKKLNEKAMWLPKKLQALMLKHCINGDGTGEQDFRGYSLEMKSQALIQQLLFISLRLGVKPTYRETGVLPRYTECEVVDGYEVFTEPKTGKKSRPGHGLWFSVRDSMTLNEFCGHADERIAARTEKAYSHSFSSEDGKWLVSKIDSTEKVAVGAFVYNIEVENDNSYVAEGVVVHNCEHVQIPELSKGKLLDAVIRPVHHKSDQGEADVYWVDILVATNRKHGDLIQKITNGELTTLSMGCFCSGTQIVMADGTFKDIEHVMVGDSVKTHTGNVARVESTRVRLADEGELSKLSITGTPNTFVTKEHPYWTLRGYDVCAGCGSEMTPGAPWNLDQIMKRWCSESCHASHKNSMWSVKQKATTVLVEQKVKFDWVKAADLRVGDYVAVPLGRPVMQRSALDKATCRILGYYVSEGNLQRKADGTPRATEFTFAMQEQSVAELKTALLQYGIAEDRIYIKDRIRTNKKTGRTNSSTRVVVHDAPLACWLNEVAGQYSHLKKLAPWVLELDDESILLIIGAMMNGDGHCRKDSARFRYSSASKKLAEQVWTMMMSVSIPVSFGGPYKQKGRKDSYSVTTRKGEAGILAKYSFKFEPQQVSQHDVQNFVGHVLRRVKAVETVPGSFFVHNIHVANEAGDHSYIANGVAVHNCEANNVTCSKCGRVMSDDDKNCQCLDKEMMQYFTDKKGIKRIVAELCGRMYKKDGKWVGDPKSCKFIEASWVERPAFTGAVLNHYVSEIPKLSSIMGFNNARLADCMEDIFKLRVADVHGMTVLRVARAEYMRRMRESMVDRLAKSLYAVR